MLENEKLRVTILVDKGTVVVELLYKPMDVDFSGNSPFECDMECDMEFDWPMARRRRWMPRSAMPGSRSAGEV